MATATIRRDSCCGKHLKTARVDILNCLVNFLENDLSRPVQVSYAQYMFRFPNRASLQYFEDIHSETIKLPLFLMFSSH